MLQFLGTSALLNGEVYAPKPYMRAKIWNNGFIIEVNLNSKTFSNIVSHNANASLQTIVSCVRAKGTLLCFCKYRLKCSKYANKRILY